MICEGTRKTDREVLFPAGRRHGHFLCGSTLKTERINEGVECCLFTDMQNNTARGIWMVKFPDDSSFQYNSECTHFCYFLQPLIHMT